jgi:hypothetical protein
VIQAPVVHACSPSYSGGRDQEDQSSKQAGQIVGEILTQIHTSQKRAGRVSQAVGPEFKAQYWEKKKNVTIPYLQKKVLLVSWN